MVASMQHVVSEGKHCPICAMRCSSEAPFGVNQEREYASATEPMLLGRAILTSGTPSGRRLNLY
jgi:hypothetical protein